MQWLIPAMFSVPPNRLIIESANTLSFAIIIPLENVFVFCTKIRKTGKSHASNLMADEYENFHLNFTMKQTGAGIGC